jgi:hypothetical protein
LESGQAPSTGTTSKPSEQPLVEQSGIFISIRSTLWLEGANADANAD